ncbi:unnamed protein product [Amoebophrya sp. A25]|nr:unnamed protein product [Amoebophrya sp. A25]|eukprot:GSA25T00027166001.1
MLLFSVCSSVGRQSMAGRSLFWACVFLAVCGLRMWLRRIRFCDPSGILVEGIFCGWEDEQQQEGGDIFDLTLSGRRKNIFPTKSRTALSNDRATKILIGRSDGAGMGNILFRLSQGAVLSSRLGGHGRLSIEIDSEHSCRDCHCRRFSLLHAITPEQAAPEANSGWLVISLLQRLMRLIQGKPRYRDVVSASDALNQHTGRSARNVGDFRIDRYEQQAIHNKSDQDAVCRLLKPTRLLESRARSFWQAMHVSQIVAITSRRSTRSSWGSDYKTEKSPSDESLHQEDTSDEHLLLAGDEQRSSLSHSVAIHVRRGDYRKSNSWHVVQGIDYYVKALRLLRHGLVERGECKSGLHRCALSIWFFSDEPDWVHQKMLQNRDMQAALLGDLDQIYVVPSIVPSKIFRGPGQGAPPVNDARHDVHSSTALLLFSLIRHHILANSSFSWWGAFLRMCREESPHWQNLLDWQKSVATPTSTTKLQPQDAIDKDFREILSRWGQSFAPFFFRTLAEYKEQSHFLVAEAAAEGLKRAAASFALPRSSDETTEATGTLPNPKGSRIVILPRTWFGSAAKGLNSTEWVSKIAPMGALFVNSSSSNRNSSSNATKPSAEWSSESDYSPLTPVKDGLGGMSLVWDNQEPRNMLKKHASNSKEEAEKIKEKDSASKVRKNAITNKTLWIMIHAASRSALASQMEYFSQTMEQGGPAAESGPCENRVDPSFFRISLAGVFFFLNPTHCRDCESLLEEHNKKSSARSTGVVFPWHRFGTGYSAPMQTARTGVDGDVQRAHEMLAVARQKLSHYDWLFKLDSDAFLYTGNLLSRICELERNAFTSSAKFYGGFLMEVVESSSFWKTRVLFASGGGGYLISSGALAESTWRGSARSGGFERCLLDTNRPYEDVAIGECFSRFDVPAQRLEGCNPDTPEMMLAWSRFPKKVEGHVGPYMSYTEERPLTFHYISPERLRLMGERYLNEQKTFFPVHADLVQRAGRNSNSSSYESSGKGVGAVMPTTRSDRASTIRRVGDEQGAQTVTSPSLTHSRPRAARTRIPRIIHQIWWGKKNPPPMRSLRTCSEVHPEFEYYLWTEESVAKYLRYDSKYATPGSYAIQKGFIPGTLNEDMEPIHVGDVLRFEVLYRFGGVAIDADTTCLRNLGPLLSHLEERGVEYAAANETDSFPEYGTLVAVGVQVAVQYSDLLFSALRALSRLTVLKPAWANTGPCIVTHVILQDGFCRKSPNSVCFNPTDHEFRPERCRPKKTEVLPSYLFYPYHHSTVEQQCLCKKDTRNSLMLQDWSSSRESYSENGSRELRGQHGQQMRLRVPTILSGTWMLQCQLPSPSFWDLFRRRTDCRQTFRCPRAPTAAWGYYYVPTQNVANLRNCTQPVVHVVTEKPHVAGRLFAVHWSALQGSQSAELYKISSGQQGKLMRTLPFRSKGLHFLDPYSFRIDIRSEQARTHGSGVDAILIRIGCQTENEAAPALVVGWSCGSQDADLL